MSAPLHVVFGAGAVGLTLAEVLHRRGQRVRVVSRTGRARVPDGVEVLAADASDPAAAREAARGAAVVHQVLAPAYARWERDFPALQAGVLAAAEAAGARLVALENVYLYGDPGGRPLTERSPVAPCTRKGRVRARMARDLLAAHEAGRVEVAIGRASDYFGPRGGAQSALGDRSVPAVLAGRRAQVVGDPDQPHTYTYVPDIAEGLAVLGEHPAAAGGVWHLPNDPATRTTRELLDVVAAVAGRPRARLRRVPAPLLRAAGLVDRDAGELVEMLYEFTGPFVVDSAKVSAELGLRATPVEDALAATVASYRDRAARAA